jgi:pimeloyl-ACP methyl ester carboxylesterase
LTLKAISEFPRRLLSEQYLRSARLRRASDNSCNLKPGTAFHRLNIGTSIRVRALLINGSLNLNSISQETGAGSRTHRRRSVLLRALLVVCCFVISLGLLVWTQPLQVLFTGAQVALRLDGVHSKYTQVDGYRIHYYVGGAGRPIVLVHGLGGRSEDWTQLIPQLVRAGNKVYALDLLGYGRAQKPRDAAYSIAQEALIVQHFIAAVGLKQTRLAGWSMGGWIAMRVAADNPQSIEKLIVYDSAGLRFVVPYDTALFWADTPEKLAKLNDLLSPSEAPALAGFIQQAVLHELNRNGWVIHRSVQSMMTGADLMDKRLGELKMPMLIVWGKQDQITPVAMAYQLHAAIPQSQLSVYDGCGHLAPRECVGKIGPRTVEFLNGEKSPGE